ncbi:MAG: CoA transferase [Alphaproteobacteria bacterium]|nr:CoA transferase [Alphaproteobacteria bacterium]
MNTAFQELMAVRNRPDNAVADITGADPVFSTRFKVAETGAGVLGAIGVAVSDIWEMKTGRRQTTGIDVRHAGAAINSFAYLQNGLGGSGNGGYETVPDSPAAQVGYAISQPFPTKDGRWFQPHFGIAHLKDRMLGVLKCEATPESIGAAIRNWNAQELEDAIAEARACGGMVRENSEWLAHPHGQALSAQPVVEIERIGDSAPEPLPSYGPPLAGVRVLDLTRILAGPVAARTLSEHGADVLMVAAKGMPQIKKFVIDLSHGKRSCYLDLNEADQATQLRELVRTGDVFSQGFRPGVLAARGFGPEELAALRPGLIYTSINCYGQHGPLQDRAGWEQVAQAMVGISHENGHGNGQDHPELLPVPACDYITGYLGAYGTLLALARRAVEGGSYHVKVSLCQTGMFLYRQGRVDYGAENMGLSEAEALPLQMTAESTYGPIRHLAPVIKFSETTPHWSSPPPALGGDAPAWLG